MSTSPIPETDNTLDALRLEFNAWVQRREEAKLVLESESILAYAVLRYLKAAKTSSVSEAFRAGWVAAMQEAEREQVNRCTEEAKAGL